MSGSVHLRRRAFYTDRIGGRVSEQEYGWLKKWKVIVVLHKNYL